MFEETQTEEFIPPDKLAVLNASKSKSKSKKRSAKLTGSRLVFRRSSITGAPAEEAD